ncbi:hypothetical protein [Inquilinus sp.]|jgi:hypothetical protein|uniref:hypothetical protein n=1 Tax=Inquilinus sp. TaxID=1932117 RepID=UPI003784AE39
MPETTVERRVALLLADIGIEIAPGGIVAMADIHKAEHQYVDHTTKPVAAAAFAVVSPSFAKGRFPNYRLVDLVTNRPSLDGTEACAIAAVCGAPINLPHHLQADEAFARQLVRVIDSYDLGAFYLRTDRGEHHRAIRPAGVDWSTEQTIPAEMQAWRQAYCALPPGRQMLTATLMWLYRGDPDTTWLGRLPCGWLAADAITQLRRDGALADWGRLVALYPGW